jgi:hypothetical protein
MTVAHNSLTGVRKKRQCFQATIYDMSVSLSRDVVAPT